MGEVDIEVARLDDADLLVSLIHRAFEQYRDVLDPPSGAHLETADTVSAKMMHGGAIIAYWQGKAIGCALWKKEDSYVYIGRLAVLREHRRFGAGSQMMGWIEEECAELGFSKLQLGVRIGLPELLSYYGNRGYHIVRYGKHEGYSEPTYVILEKDLAQR